ncbi:MAG: BamA/OMP85 family outer membrane protein [Longimicrobiales bacterium]
MTLAMAFLLDAAAPVPALAQGVPFADSVEIAEISFDGARAFDEEVLASTIVSAATRCYSLRPLCWLDIGRDRQFLDSRVLEADAVRLRVFYYRQGFRETEIAFDTTRRGGRTHITFHIDEGQPVRVATIDFDGAGDMPGSVTRGLPLAVGRPLSLIDYEAARDTITGRLRDLGYALADVFASYDIPADSPNGARVLYELAPGRRARFGTIEIAGAASVSQDVVTRMLRFRSGDVYSQAALLSSQRNLFAQELFRHAELRPVTSAESDTLVDVVVQVNEARLHRVGFGLGISTADYVNAEGRWASRNFLGGARRLELRGRIANVFANPFSETIPLLFEDPSADIYRRLAGSITADFSQPHFFDARNTLGAGVYVERYSLPNVFVRSGGGGYVSFTRAFDPGNALTLGYRPELTELETAGGDRIFCLGFLACEPNDIDALRELHWLSPVVASWTIDRSNSIFEPSRGFAIRLDAEHAGAATGSDFSYTRLLADFTDYSTLARDLVLALRVRFGWAGQLGAADTMLGVHPQKRLFAGGPNSVRGFAFYRLGPKVLTVDAAEWLARPADAENGGAGCTAQQINGGTCDAHAFAESSPELFEVRPTGGTVLYEANVELRFPVFRDHVHGATFLDVGQVWIDRQSARLGDVVVTPGVGVRYFSPIGPLRVDIGYNPLGVQELDVVTTEVEYCPPSGGDCEAIVADRVYDPATLRNTELLQGLGAVSWDPRRSFFDRLQLHFSIGQAF